MSERMTEQPVVVITGASAGVGRAVAVAFARRGAAVGLLAREPDALEDTRAEVERAGGRALAMPTDVADADAVSSAADRVVGAFGPIDIWVNNAMVTVLKPVKSVTPDEVRRVTEVTYLGSVNGMITALRHMLPRDQGTIVQVGSALAYRGIPLQAPYCGAKFALRGFMDALRSELIHDGSRVALTAVHLPAVNTPQFEWARTGFDRQPRPVAPVFQPDPIGEAIVHAAFHPQREYWIGGSTVKTIVGAILAPGLLDRYLADTVYSGQLTDDEVGSERPDNLFTPVKGVHRTRGRFDAEAADQVTAYPPDLVRAVLATGGLVLAAGLAFGFNALTRR